MLFQFKCCFYIHRICFVLGYYLYHNTILRNFIRVSVFTCQRKNWVQNVPTKRRVLYCTSCESIDHSERRKKIRHQRLRVSVNAGVIPSHVFGIKKLWETSKNGRTKVPVKTQYMQVPSYIVGVRYWAKCERRLFRCFTVETST